MDKKIGIIEAAQQLFYEFGIRATKMIDVANHLQMSKKTLYQVFRSKEELVNAVYMGILDRINEQAEEVVKSDMAFSDQLVEYIVIIDSAVTYSSPRINKEIKEDYPILSKKVSDYLKNAVFNRFHRLLKKGKEEGMLGDSVTVETVILLYRDAISNYLTNQYNSNLPASFQLSQSKAKRLFCENLITIFRGVLAEDTQTKFNATLRSHRALKHINFS